MALPKGRSLVREVGQEVTYRVNRFNKYGATRSEYDGIRYDSKMEAAYAAQLDTLKAGGAIVNWRRQVTIPLAVNGRHICNYRVDFEVAHNDGHLELIEVKGFETPVWQLKWKLLEAIYGAEHPDVELTVVK
jgi:hypothetical protein